MEQKIRMRCMACGRIYREYWWGSRYCPRCRKDGKADLHEELLSLLAGEQKDRADRF